MIQFSLELDGTAQSCCVQVSGFNGMLHSKFWFIDVRTVAESAHRCQHLQVIESLGERSFIAPDLDLSHTGCIDEQAAIGQLD